MESASLLEERPARRASRASVVAVLAGSAIAGVALAGSRGGGGQLLARPLSLSERLSSALTRLPLDIEVSDEYTRRDRTSIGEGLYPYDYLVQVHKPTLLTVRDATSASAVLRSVHSLCAFEYTWVLPSLGVAPLVGEQVEVSYDTLGYHRLQVQRAVIAPAGVTATLSPRMLEVSVMCKYVRREIRSMTDADRNGFFEALRTIYVTSQSEGTAVYGTRFRSIEYLVAEHLHGAASRECDHWHDDAGILTHHMAFTLELEQSLQAIDRSVAMPYWDYTADAYFLGREKFHLSPIFQSDWFGALSPANSDHVIDAGRWAYTSIATVASADPSLPSSFSKIKNPYGLLRSPWNTNPSPYLTRFHDVLGVEFGGFDLPTCGQFIEAYEHDTLGYLFSEVRRRRTKAKPRAAAHASSARARVVHARTRACTSERR